MPTEPKTELEMLDTERARRKLEVVDAPDTEPSDSFVLEGVGA